MRLLIKSFISGIPAGFILIAAGSLMGTIKLPDFVGFNQLYLLSWIFSVYLGLGIFYAICYSLLEKGLKLPGILKGLVFSIILWLLTSIPLTLKMILFSSTSEVFNYFLSQPFLTIVVKDLVSFILLGLLINIIHDRYLIRI